MTEDKSLNYNPESKNHSYLEVVLKNIDGINVKKPI